MEYDSEAHNIAIFNAECNNPDIQVRLHAMRKLPILATTLGARQTHNELMPYLDVFTDGIYNDNEVLLILAEQLGQFLPLVGGNHNAASLISILEKLASAEENVVREKAIESLKIVATSLDNDHIQTYFPPMILRLATAEWFTSKLAAAALFSVSYHQVSQNDKSELRHIYRLLCQDESPLVRRASAVKFTSFAKVLEVEWLLDEFIPVFNNFAKESQDSIRAFAVDFGISIAERLRPKEIEDYIVPTLTELSNDSSWEVRYQTAYHINAIQLAIGRELTNKCLIPIYQRLVDDAEPQVREASAKNIVRFCEILQNTYSNTESEMTETTDPFIIRTMLPMIHDLNNDGNSHVKEALATVLASLCSVIRKDDTRKFLLPIIMSSLVNDSLRVKENIIANLNRIISIVGVIDIIDTVLNIITDLLNTSNSLWRTRRNLIVTISYLALHTGREYFDDHLKILYKMLLNDGVYAVRQTAPLILPILSKSFGMQWAIDSISPIIAEFADNKHYLYRFVCLFCIDEFIFPTLSTAAGTEFTYIQYINKTFQENTCEEYESKVKKLIAKLTVLNKNLTKKLQQNWVHQALNKLEQDYVTDDNIQRYAEDTIEIFMKDNRLDILNISEKELLQKGNDIYLEGVLYLSIYQFLPILKKLCSDPIHNVQIKAAKTVIKIQNLSTCLEQELSKTFLNCGLETSLLQEYVNRCEFADTDNESVCEEIQSNIEENQSVTANCESKLSLPIEFVENLQDKLHAALP